MKHRTGEPDEVPPSLAVSTSIVTTYNAVYKKTRHKSAFSWPLHYAAMHLFRPPQPISTTTYYVLLLS